MSFSQVVLFQLPRPLGRGLRIVIVLLALAKQIFGLKPGFLFLLYPRPKGRGNSNP